MNKGVIIGVSALVGIGALVAFSRDAKAATPVAVDPNDTYSPQKCQAYKAERQIAAGQVAQLTAKLPDIDAARIEAGMNEEWDLLAALDAQRQNIVNTRNNFQARVNQLDALIAKCP